MESFLKALAASRWFCRLLPAIICVAVVAAYWRPLHLDLWNDELYSLLYFQQVPLHATVTDYHETNNHIFFNLLLNLYLRAIGRPATLTVLQHPEMVRAVLLVFTLLTYALLYRLVKCMAGVWPALLACVLLTATLPYYNFALQYRAYSLVILLGTAYLYVLWRYLNDGGRHRLAMIFGSGALIFYAHPAGIYLVIALIAGTAVAFLGSLQRHDSQRQRALYASGTTLLGGLFGGLAYLPVLRQLLANPWVSGHRISFRTFFIDKFSSCSLQLICSRYWLVVLAAAGAVLCMRAARQSDEAARQRLRWMVFCGIVYLVPFTVPMLRRDDAPQRTFTILIPFLVAGITLALESLSRALFAGRYRHTIVLVICMILLAEIPLLITRRNKLADELVIAGKENATLVNGYYLHHFHPMDIALLAAGKSKETGLPVYCGIVYRQEMPHYLESIGVAWKDYRTPARRGSSPDSCYVITAYPQLFARQYGAGAQCGIIETPPSFYQLLLVTRSR